MKIKTKILYAKGEKDGKSYNIYIYAVVDLKKKTGKKISEKEFKKDDKGIR